MVTALRGLYQMRLMIHDTVAERVALRPEDLSEDDLWIRSSVETGIYEHFKSTETARKYYAVFGVARKVNRGEPHDYDYHVAYCALYPPHQFQLATRELVGPDSFLMPIDRPEYIGARFRHVQACTLDYLLPNARTYIATE